MPFFACNKSRCKNCYKEWLRQRRRKIRNDPEQYRAYLERARHYDANRPKRAERLAKRNVKEREVRRNESADRHERRLRAQRENYQRKILDPEYVERVRANGREAQARRRQDSDYLFREWCRNQEMLYGKGAVEMRERMLLHQQSRCAICNVETDLHLDHDHATKEVRGLLCPLCNKGIGIFKDNPALLSQAIAYLLNPPIKEAARI